MVAWLASEKRLNSGTAIFNRVQVSIFIHITFIYVITEFVKEMLKYLITLIIKHLVDCKWSDWSQWDLCTKTCGGGMQARTRHIVIPERNGGKTCVGEPLEMRTCNMQACQSM